jgi:sigma-B regulation protein RsbU (phosphoserine phosphatase)
MDTKIFQRIRESLQRQRQSLLDWLQYTPAAKKQINLGPVAEAAVQAHLHLLDTALAKAEDKTLGVCRICHDYVEPDRLEMDFTTNVCLSHYSAEEMRRLEAELELAHKVHKALLPQELPQIRGLQLAAFIQPADIVGGDYFDFFRFRDGAPGLAIADVMGKGLPASMLMASMQASLRILAPENTCPARVLQRLNGLFCHNVHLIKFITIFLGRFDPATRKLEYCNAGHNPPLLLRGNHHNDPHWLQPTGAAIGLAESFEYRAETVALAPGDAFVLYTDGVTEAMNAGGEEFGDKRLAEIADQHRALPPQNAIRELRTALQAFTGRQAFRDDVTIVAGKVE